MLCGISVGDASGLINGTSFSSMRRNIPLLSGYGGLLPVSSLPYWRYPVARSPLVTCCSSRKSNGRINQQGGCSSWKSDEIILLLAGGVFPVTSPNAPSLSHPMHLTTFPGPWTLSSSISLSVWYCFRNGHLPCSHDAGRRLTTLLSYLSHALLFSSLHTTGWSSLSVRYTAYTHWLTYYLFDSQWFNNVLPYSYLIDVPNIPYGNISFETKWLLR